MVETQEENENNQETNYIDNWYSKLRNDITNLNLFWKEHKHIIYWIIVVFFIAQYVDIVGPKSSILKACFKQRGGKEGAPGGAPAGGQPSAPKARPSSAAPTTGRFQSFRTAGPLNNIFGRFGAIFKNAFKIIGVVFLIAVLGFLPIIIMIIFTYKIIRFFAKKVRGL
jgi:hypothetical protein